MSSIVFSSFLFFFSTLSLSDSGPIVDTPYGKVEGFVHTTGSGFKANVFLGIKYASAERFENPVKAAKWDGVFNASKWGKKCHTWIDLYENLPGIAHPEEFSEDCLSMNIMVPSKMSSPSPVWFFINCGGWSFGDSPTFRYKTFTEQFVSRGVIMVSFNYRLGVYGWMSLGDDESPGNMGLWDTKIALDFAREILPSFGGDITRITVGGESAGGTMTSAMQYSEHTKYLFSQGIQMSGSFFTEWANQQLTVNITRQLSTQLGCTMEKSKEVKDCLRKKTPKELSDGLMKVGPSANRLGTFVFHPRLDGKFVTQEMIDNFHDIPKKPMFIGFHANESSILCTYGGVPYFSGAYRTPEVLGNFSRQDVVDYCRDVVFADTKLENSEEAVQRLTDLYMTLQNDFTVGAYAQLQTDLQFTLPALQELSWWRYNGWKDLFLYVTYVVSKPGDVEGPLRGAWHATELRYISDFNMLPGNWTEDNYKFQKAICEAIANFVKNGDPSTSTFKWPRITNEEPFVHGAFIPEPFRESEYRPEVLQFWSSLYSDNLSSSIRERLPGIEVSAHTYWCTSYEKWSRNGTTDYMCKSFNRDQYADEEMEGE